MVSSNHSNVGIKHKNSLRPAKKRVLDFTSKFSPGAGISLTTYYSTLFLETIGFKNLLIVAGKFLHTMYSLLYKPNVKF